MSLTEIRLPAQPPALHREDKAAFQPISLRNLLVISALAAASWGALFGMVELARSALHLFGA